MTNNAWQAREARIAQQAKMIQVKKAADNGDTLRLLDRAFNSLQAQKESRARQARERSEQKRTARAAEEHAIRVADWPYAQKQCERQKKRENAQLASFEAEMLMSPNIALAGVCG